MNAGLFVELSGLRTLKLDGLGLTSLPEGLSARLPNLEELSLNRNRLSLTAGMFAGFGRVQRLALRDNALVGLPDLVFVGLESLLHLDLGDNALNTINHNPFITTELSNPVSRQILTLSLRNNRFSRLTQDSLRPFRGVQELDLSGNRLQTLSALAFTNNNALRSLDLRNNRLAAIPDGLFANLSTTVSSLALEGNLGAPFTLATRLRQSTGSALEVRAELPTAAPFAVTMALSARSATLSAASVTIARGETASEWVTVTPTGGVVTVTGVPSAVIPASVTGLLVPAAPPALRMSSTGVCGRSEAAQRALEAATGETDCADVTPEDLLMAGGVVVTGNDVTTLSRGDFRGVATQSVQIENTKLTTLPAGLFEGVVDIVSFSISQNADLTSVEAGLFDGLTFPIATMHFNENGLTSLPAGLFQGMRVNYLNMLGNADLVFTDGMFSGLTMGSGTLNLQNSGLSTLPAGLFRGIRTDTDKLSIDLTPGSGSLRNLGSPFTLNLEMEVTPGESDNFRNVRVKLKEAALEDVEVALTVTEGMEIRPSSVVIPQGEVVSDTAVLHLAGNGWGTIGLDIPAVPSHWKGVSEFTASPASKFMIWAWPVPRLSAVSHANSVVLNFGVFFGVPSAQIFPLRDRFGISGYEYRFISDDVASWSPWTTVDGGITVNETTVSGLSAGTEYRFEVRSVSSDDAGPAATVVATPHEPQPLPQIEDQIVRQHFQFRITLPEADFGVLPYTYELEITDETDVTKTLPTWLKYSARTFFPPDISGNPDSTGKWAITYSVTDAAGAVQTRQFKLIVPNPGNSAPEGQNPAGNPLAEGTSLGRLDLKNDGKVTYYQDQAVTKPQFGVSPMFSDRNNDSLTIKISYEPPPASMRIHGMGLFYGEGRDLLGFQIATVDKPAEWTITVTADDGEGGRTSRPLTLVGQPPPDLSVPEFTSDAAVADLQLEVGREMAPLVLPAAVGGDRPPVAEDETPIKLRYRTSVLPAGLHFDAETRTLSGVPEAGAAGVYMVEYLADDRDANVRRLDAAIQRFTVRIASGVCSRPTAVRNALVAASGAADCAAVSRARLAVIETLDLSSTGLVQLHSRDLEGLSGLRNLDLSDNRGLSVNAGLFAGLSGLRTLKLNGLGLTSLPEGLSARLPNLEELSLNRNRLSLTAGMFAGFGRVKRLALRGNALTGLPDKVFVELESLLHLDLGDNALNKINRNPFIESSNPVSRQIQTLSLRNNRFSRLTQNFLVSFRAVQELDLSGNRLQTLSALAFTDNNALRSLDLRNNRLAAIPDGLFANLSTTVSSLALEGNLGAPFTLATRLRQSTGSALEVRAELPTAAPFAVTMALSARSATLSAASVTIARGETASEWVTVTPTGGVVTVTGEPSAVIPAGVTGLLVPAAPPTLRMSSTGVCGRSEAAQRALEAATGETDCANVTPEDLLMAGGVIVTGNDVTTLSRGDFRGVATQSVAIENTKLTTLPAGLFEGIVDIVSFSISQNADLTSVEAGLFDGLTFPIATVHLNENGLTSLPAGLFQGMRVNDLNMRGNADLVFTDGMFSGLTMGSGALNLQNSGLSTLPAGLFQGIRTNADALRIDLTPGRGSLGNPGSPFTLNLEMEVTPGESDNVRNVRVKLKEGAPEDIEIVINKSPGVEIRPSSVVIPQGEVVSDSAEVHFLPAANGLATVGLHPVPTVPTRWKGISEFTATPLLEAIFYAWPVPDLYSREYANAVDLTFNLPNSHQAIPRYRITDYEYRFSSDDGASWSQWTKVADGMVAQAVLVTGLSGGTEYRFELRTVSSDDAGPAATVVVTPLRPQPLPQVDNQVAVINDNNGLIATLPEANFGVPPYTYALSGTKPEWLTFFPQTRRLWGGTPRAAGQWNLTYQATDATGAVQTQEFTLKARATENRPPEGLNRAGQKVDSGTSIGRKELPINGGFTVYDEQNVSAMFRDPDGDTLTFQLNYENLPANMRLHGRGIKVISDEILMQVATADRRTEGTITVTADDGHGGRETRPLTLIGYPPPDNAVPEFTSDAAVADLQLEVGREMTPLVLPAAVGGDRPPVASGDAPFELRYRTSVLPAGLYFDAATRTLSGAPKAGTVGTHVVEVRADDRDANETQSDAAIQRFTIRIVPGICVRTAAVRTALVAASGAADCAAVSKTHLAAIETLDLSGTGLVQLLPRDLNGLSGLRNLDLSDNRGLSVSAGLFVGLSSLRTLKLDGLGLTSLPTGLSTRLPNLEELSLNRNRLSLTAGMFAGFGRVQRLALRDNALTGLPDLVFVGLESLLHLDLGDNALNTINQYASALKSG